MSDLTLRQRVVHQLGASKVAVSLLSIGLLALLLGALLEPGYLQTVVAGVACSVIAGAIFEALLTRQMVHVGPTPPKDPRRQPLWLDTSGDE